MDLLDLGDVSLRSEISIHVKLFEIVDTTYEGMVCKRKDLVRKLLKRRDLSPLFLSISKEVH